ncbi:MAG: cell division protein FtsX [Marinilabiliaceae bacterium]|nr:permease-like cell division protein FtsX [Bacteroidales bacterium]MDD5816206.1 permease-like cell division protein FtsX [Bacteroidales bacterium]MDY4520515.1 permease-like cell division protein FtsX [Bacteroidales bacterium]
MHNQSNTAATRKLRSSYFTTTISIALVLFLLGMIGLLLLNAQRVSAYVKENLCLTVTFRPDARDAEVRQIEKQLLATPQVKSVDYIDKDEAARRMEKSLGEDFLSTLRFNPLLPTMEVKLFADYTDAESMEQIAQTIRGYKPVREVNFERDVVNLIHENIRKISLVLLGFSLLMLLVAVTLINNTVRLMVYSKRFLIRTMQLVGATRSFIRRPFLLNSLLQGLIGGLVANGLLTAVIMTVSRSMPGVIGFDNTVSVAVLFGLVFLVGMLITLCSTASSVNKYLSLRTADLYV